MKNVWAATGFFLWSSFLGIGCSDVLESGHYEGVLRQSQTNSPLGDVVALDLEFPNLSHGLLHVMNREMKMTVKIDDISETGFSLTVPGVDHPAFSLNAVAQNPHHPERKCFVARDSWNAEFCAESRFITFRLVNPEGQNVFHLFASRFAIHPDLKLEGSSEFTLERAIAVALSGEQESFQKEGKLFPPGHKKGPQMSRGISDRIHLPTLMNFLPGVPLFLLVEEFISNRRNAPPGEKVIEKILKDSRVTDHANLVAVIEQASYALNRDQKILGLYVEGRKKVQEFQEELRKLLSPEQSADANRLDSLVTKLRASELLFEKQIQEDRLFLSVAMGLHNPEAVQTIAIAPLKVEELGETLNAVDLGKIALSRSFELEQFTFQKVVSQETGSEMPVHWVKSGEAGLELKSSDLSFEKMQRWVMAAASQAGIEYNYALENFKLWHGDFQSHPLELDAVFQQTRAYVEVKKKFANRNLSRRIRSVLRKKASYIASEADFRIARSKVDRVLLKGSFELLLPQLETVTAVEGQKGVALRPVEMPLGSAPKGILKKAGSNTVGKGKSKKVFIASSLPSADADINPFKRTRQSSLESEKSLGVDRGKQSALPEFGVRWVPLE